MMTFLAIITPSAYFTLFLDWKKVQRSLSLSSFNESRSNVLDSSIKKLFVSVSAVYPRIWTHSPSRIEGIGNRYALANIHVPLGAFACEVMNTLIKELSSPVNWQLGGTQLDTCQLGLHFLSSTFCLFILSLPHSSKSHGSEYIFCEWISASLSLKALRHQRNKNPSMLQNNVASGSGMLPSEALAL